MSQPSFKPLVTLLACFFLSSCGGSGGSGSAPEAGKPLAADQIPGYWKANNKDAESYEFYQGSHTAPYVTIKSGSIFQGTQYVGMFYWTSASDGSIKMTKVAPACDLRPISQCPITGLVTAYPGNVTAEGANWKFAYDDNHDGVVDRTVSDEYKHPNVDLSSLAQGDFYLSKGEVFSSPWLGLRSGNQLGIRIEVAGQPVPLSLAVPATPSLSVTLNGAGEPSAVKTSSTFTMKDGSRLSIPIKVWTENVTLSAGANNGFILEYAFHRKVMFPKDVDPNNVDVKDFETPQQRSASFARVDQFIHGPTIRANDRFATLLPADFDPDWALLGAGNEINFTSATEGNLSHIDFHNGLYSEHRKFSWKQKDDGRVVMSFISGLEITMRFIKDINGGYQVVYTIPHPTLGLTFFQHDLIRDNLLTLSDSELEGRYVFISTDGLTRNELILHKDKRVSGVVAGFWFRDTNGDVVGYECTDLQEKEIADYDQCYAQLNDTSKVSYVHLRRLKFMQKNGNEFLVKYNAALYGERWGVLNRDYMTASLTYRFIRVGNE
ncbi:MAG: hypothetical protein K2P84_02050 [Undibacterium sp.]|nr:hypothetical protein [Undibacterium sp.]